MSAILSFLLILTASIQILYAKESDLQFQEQITHLKTLYSKEKYQEYNYEISKIKDKKITGELIYFTLSSNFHTGKYEELEKLQTSLPPFARNSLFIKEMRLRSFFARKHYISVLKLLDEIEKEDLLYYEKNSLICIRADIELYRKNYDKASEIYDECLKTNRNENTVYNSIEAKNKGKNNNKSLLAEYINFIQEFPASRYNQHIAEIISNVKEKYSQPDEKSPLFTLWLNVMRKMGKLEPFFRETWLNLEHPASMEIIKFLEEKERYKDATEYIDKIIDSGKVKGSLYYYAWQKFKILKNWKGAEEASSYLYEYSEKLNGENKETALFYSALGYFESGNLNKAEEIFLSSFILKDKKGQYYTESVYKLGLIYLIKEQAVKTYALWTEWIKHASKSTKYHAMIKEMKEILSIAGSASIPWPVETPQQEKIIDYYDIVNYETNDADLPYLKEKSTGGKTDLWRKNKLDKNPRLSEEILKVLKTTPVKYREEPYSMIKEFTEKGFKEGIFFYTRNIIRLASFAKNRNDTQETKAKYYTDMNKYMAGNITKLIYEYLGNASETINYSYGKIIKKLPFSPKEGEQELWKVLYPTPYLNEILKISEELDISPAMIYAIMRSETFYRADLISPVGAQGLMQIMPKTLKKIENRSGTKIRNTFDPYENLKASAWYMKKLLERFDGNILLAAAGYNAGPHRVSDWLRRFPETRTYLFIELIPFRETRNYVKKVMKYYHIYTYLYENRTPCLGSGEILNVKEKPDAVDF